MTILFIVLQSVLFPPFNRICVYCIFVIFAKCLLLWFCICSFIYFMHKSGSVLSEQSALWLFLGAWPRRGSSTENLVSNYFRSIILAVPNDLPWRKKRETTEQEILSSRCLRKPSSDRGTRWWTVSPKSFSECRQWQVHLQQAAGSGMQLPSRYKLTLIFLYLKENRCRCPR